MKYMKIITLFFVSCSLFCAIVSFAMDIEGPAQQESADPELVALEKSEDVKRFTGQVVAFESAKPLMGCWKDAGKQFGYIDPEEKEWGLPVYSYDAFDSCAMSHELVTPNSLGKAHELCSVVPVDTDGVQCVLTNIRLDYEKFKMRVATIQEIKNIRDKAETKELIIALSFAEEVNAEEKLLKSTFETLKICNSLLIENFFLSKKVK